MAEKKSSESLELKHLTMNSSLITRTLQISAETSQILLCGQNTYYLKVQTTEISRTDCNRLNNNHYYSLSFKKLNANHLIGQYVPIISDSFGVRMLINGERCRLFCNSNSALMNALSSIAI